MVRRDAEPKTYEGYAYTAGLIKPTLGKMPLDKLTPQHEQKLLNELLERGGAAGAGLSPSTVQYVRATLRRALGQALKWGLVTRNVATLVEPPKSRRAEVQFLTEEEARALLAAARGARLEALYAVALTLSLRQGELLGLRWEDIDQDTGTLRVAKAVRSVGGKLAFGGSETLQQSLADPLARQRAERAGRSHVVQMRTHLRRSWHLSGGRRDGLTRCLAGRVPRM